MYLVRFIRTDHKPNEEYYYNLDLFARSHYELFLDDDSGLYDKVQLLHYDIDTDEETLIAETSFIPAKLVFKIGREILPA